jgi:hypothetical protein
LIMELSDWDVSNSHSHRQRSAGINLRDSPVHNHALSAIAARRTGRDIASLRLFKTGGLQHRQASATMLRGAYLKYLRSGGFWPFFVGMRRPSALTM